VIISRTCGPLQPGERHSKAFSPHKRELDPRSGVTVWRLHDLRRTVVSGIQKKQGFAKPSDAQKTAVLLALSVAELKIRQSAALYY
jgi:hypothetical protein